MIPECSECGRTHTTIVCPQPAGADALIDPSAEEPDSNARQRILIIGALEHAAIVLRDAELARIEAGKQYGEALEAFNRFVAPVEVK